jgi:hypothetical protein
MACEGISLRAEYASILVWSPSTSGGTASQVDTKNATLRLVSSRSFAKVLDLLNSPIAATYIVCASLPQHAHLRFSVRLQGTLSSGCAHIAASPFDIETEVVATALES